MVIGDILSRLKGVKRLNEHSYQARCPCHDDKQQSLTVSSAGDKVLMYCHAGCNIRNIVSNIGLEMKDLDNSYVPKQTWKDKIQDLEAVYDYGGYLKIRCKDKKMYYGHIVNDKFVNGMPNNIDKTLYGLEIIREAIKKHKTVYIVEGEKDADNMNKRGLACCTAGGVSSWKTEFAQNFKGADVVILPDNDEPGQELAERIDKDIKNIAFSIRIVTVSNKEKGDVSDYFEDGNTVADLIKLVNCADKKYADWVIQGGKGLRINAGILADCISSSLKYIILKKSGIDVADFYVYENGVYLLKSRMEFKGCIKEYVPVAYQTDTLLNNVTNLMLASNDNSYDYDMSNNDENIINFKNGLYDLAQNELIKHTDEKITTYQLDCNYDPKSKCTRWIEFINTLCSDDNDIVDEEKKAVLQEWFGLLMSNSNVSRTKKCLALYSTLGDTGKSKYLDILSYIVGDKNTAHIPIQNMSDRFAMGNLYGKRLNCVGDQKATDIEDSSVFKQLTGGDPLGVEMKGKTAFQFRFKGGFAFACNDLPCFKDDKGGHIFDRFTIIKCERYLKAHERDKTLIDKLLAEKDGIAAWGIEGLKRLQKNGFNFTPCKSSDEAIAQYRGNVDTFYKFLTQYYKISFDKSDRVKKTELESLYSKWCKDNEYSEIKKKNIKERAAKSGIELSKYQGDWYYKGLKEILYTESEVESEDELPF